MVVNRYIIHRWYGFDDLNYIYVHYDVISSERRLWTIEDKEGIKGGNNMDIFKSLHNILRPLFLWLTSLNWPLILIIGFVIGIILLIIDKKHYKTYFITKKKSLSEYYIIRFPGVFMKDKDCGIDIETIGWVLVMGCAICFYLAFIFYEIDMHL